MDRPRLAAGTGFLKGHDRWASAGHHPVTLCSVIGFQRRTGFVNGASLLLAAFKWAAAGSRGQPGPPYEWGITGGW